ncbi:hypothetical protein QR680_003175 [Steinernema hermaphroditum]|uniref:Ion transport domain-containing protein n=1 Tax=Steinernema hermaphroditum TaxID=289476 RepID=A0AA39H5P4_9BILA|nr:hypothetical protein QR680_003175 [Steinernema hermaphroditum]
MDDYKLVKLKSNYDPEAQESARLVDDNDDNCTTIMSIDGKPIDAEDAEALKLNLTELRCSPELPATNSTRKVYSTREIDCNLYGKNGDVAAFLRDAEHFEKEAIAKMLNTVDDDLPPLHYAVRHGHLQMIRVFLRFGANPDVKNKDEQTPLHFAAKYKPNYLPELVKKQGASPEIVRQARLRTLRTFAAPDTIISVLLKNGATTDSLDRYECTPLHYAALKDNKEEARQLISIGRADVHACELHGYTPLHLAANHGSEGVAELLLENGARVHDMDDRRNTALHLACRNGHEQIVRLLLRKITDKEERQKYVELTNSEENNCLHLAALKGHIDVVNEIFNSDVNINVNVTRKDRVTLLHLAAAKGSYTLCEKLIEQGAIVSAEDIDRRTPLDYAAYNNRDTIIEFLLQQQGVNIECRTKDLFTPFLTAVSENHQEAVEVLCKHGCDLSAVDIEQRSAIFLAAKFNGIAILKFLLEDEAENAEAIKVFVNKQTSTYETPMHIAAANDYMEVLTLLKEKGADIRATGDDEQTPLHLACERDHIEIVRQLIEWDESTITDVDDNGNTPLHYAAKEGNLQMVQELIDYGADVFARNSYEETALDIAVRGGHVDVVQALIDERAPLEPPQNNVTTALHIATEEGHDELIELLLLREQLTIDKVNEQGQTCLDIAIAKNNSRAVKTILQAPDWRNVLRVCSGRNSNHKHKLRCTPMCQLIRDMPDMAKIVFDKCVTNVKDEFGNVGKEMDYEFINDSYVMKPSGDGEHSKTAEKYPYEPDGRLKKDAVLNDPNYDNVIKTHPLQIMVNSERIDLLKHKLVASLIRHKWNTYARYIYYMALFIYIVFLSSFTIYVSNTLAPFNAMDQNTTWTVTGSLNERECAHISARRPLYLDLFRKLTMLLAIGQIMKEVYQLLNRWWRYFNVENCFEVCLYIGSFLVCWDMTPCTALTGIRLQWQWMLAGVMIFCAWINLILLIRKIPRFGIYVVMVVNTIKTFYRFSLIFALFIIAFSSGFFVVLQNKPEFASYLPSFVKTTVMMIGEFEYTAIFYEEEEGVHESHLFGRPIAHVIFMVFMVVMNVILMNLLVGLAVDDIKGVLERAELMRLRMQVQTIVDIERALPDWFRQRRHRGKEVLYSNRKKVAFNKSFLLNCWRYLGYTRAEIEELQEEEYDDYDEKANVVISNQNRNMRAIENISRNMREMYDAMGNAYDRINKLQDKTDNIEKLLLQLLDRKNEGQRARSLQDVRE